MPLACLRRALGVIFDRFGALLIFDVRYIFGVFAGCPYFWDAHIFGVPLFLVCPIFIFTFGLWEGPWVSSAEQLTQFTMGSTKSYLL